MKIYTKTGDKGTTSLIYGERVAKHDIRVEAYGTCDEANSAIGVALSLLPDKPFVKSEETLTIFHKIQTILFHVGAELATPVGKEVKWQVKQEDVEDLEKTMDEWNEDLPQLTTFILPGGSSAGAQLHLARTIVRRAERVATSIGTDVNPIVLQYLNRLSDFLFVAARYLNHKLGAIEKTLHEDVEN
ncbi:ATP:cob(I)alamin adenosyltransferase [Lottiidibacillus patelloidae]|uniref:Corrinoid adenosyltransferase n=1 Tax=Lottiidibacillus patelloidae TaxID=2670334 RepID=A0A263BTT1_9BACI|nr:cob(I)yrinic acid a,c-diamide adenosyltransferase [Lottiidibacillus patelloidae]OZM57085.1 ATP:cob(I)alamin adenosyltransferase [Lottiidibacillus patelloidae]